MAGLAAFSTLVVWLSAQRNLEEAVYPARLNRMAADVQVLATTLGSAIDQAAQDVLLLRQAPATRRVVQALAADGQSGEAQRADLAGLFTATLHAKPDYLQVRLLSARADGREVVRAERAGAGGEIRVVPDADLQDKGGRPYFAAALASAEGEVYVSPIELNREFGAIQEPRIPVVRTALPVRAGSGEVVALLIINLDLTRIFAAMQASAPFPTELAIIDEQGDFLLHPEAGRAFADAQAPRYGIQDELPGLSSVAEFFARPGFTGALTDADEVERGIAAVRLDLAPGNRIAVVLMAARSNLLASASRVLGTIALSGLAALLVAGLLVVWIAWRTLRPLGRIARAVEAVDRGETVRLPSGAGEIGVLARTFESHLARERLFSAAFAWANDAALTTDFDGVITGWNRAAEGLFGFSPDEAVGQSKNLIVPEDRMAEAADMRRRFRSGEPVVGLQTVRQAKDGRRIEVELTLSPVRAPDGRVVGASEIVRDVTARKADEARFRLAVEASPAAMLMTDEAGVILMANSEAEAIFGYRVDELVGQPVELLLPEPMRGAHRQLRMPFQADPGKRMMGAGRDLLARRKDGSTFSVEVGLNPLRTPDGLVILSAILDTTERKRNELALRLAKQEAERASAMKTQFLANMSHELRTPLNAIIGYSDLMLSEVAGAIQPAKYAGYLEDIKRGGGHLLSLINDLLDLSRAESGLLALDEEQLDLVALAADAVDLMGAEAELKGLALSLTAEARSIDLRGDQRMLTQILLNLLSNAVKFTPAGGVVGVVVNRTFDGAARLIVKDNGIGMPSSQIPRAFAAFVQVEDAYRREGNRGAGLGLALTKRFVELHHGRIAMDSTPDLGTTVTVIFPAGRCLPARLPGRQKSETRQQQNRSNGG